MTPDALIPSDAYVIALLARLSDCDAVALNPLRGEGGGVPLLAELVARGALTRVAARAVVLSHRAEYDEADLRQLVHPTVLRRGLEELAAEAEGDRRQRATMVAGSDSGTPRKAPRSLLRLGDRVGKFLVKGLLGGGAVGEVYLATHQTLNIAVALKVFSPVVRVAEGTLFGQFRDEARLLARLNHPNIVRILDFEDADPPMMVLEYMDGNSLADLVRPGVPLEPGSAFAWAMQAARGLRAAHRLGITHLDVKPGNLLSNLDGTVKLADFGIARLRGALGVDRRARPDGPALLQGTLAYMAPERHQGVATVKADIYALGLVAFQMLAGGLPAPGELLHHRAPGVGVPLSQLVARMTDPDPERRPGGYDEVIAGFEDGFDLKLDTV